MLLIFRQLRRLELHKRSGRYLLYALGEIVLIVAGILIAVQIGDWKEERKQEDEAFLEAVSQKESHALLSVTYRVNRATLNRVKEMKTKAVEILAVIESLQYRYVLS